MSNNPREINWKLLYVSYGVVEGNILKALLESHGVHVKLWDELANSGYSEMLANSTGVRVMVQDNQIEKGYQILKEKGYIKEEVPNATFLDKFINKSPLDAKNRLLMLGVFVCLLLVVVVGILAFLFG